MAATDLAVLLTLKGMLSLHGTAAMAAWRSGCFRCVAICEVHILSAVRAATGELLAGLLSAGAQWARELALAPERAIFIFFMFFHIRS